MTTMYPAARDAAMAETAVFHSELYPVRVAVVDGGRRYSYRQLAERSWRLASALRSAGLGKGDRVATLLVNSAATLEAHFGVPTAGGVLVAVNHRLAGAEVGYILAHSV